MILCGTNLSSFFVVLAALFHGNFGLKWCGYMSTQKIAQHLCTTGTKHRPCAHNEPLDDFAAQHNSMEVAIMTKPRLMNKSDRLLDNWRWQAASEQLHMVCVAYNRKSVQSCRNAKYACLPIPQQNQRC